MGAIELYNAAIEKPLAVYEIFKEFFGEERVDIQDIPTFEDTRNLIYDGETVPSLIANINYHYSYPFILVHFPHVTVKNEHDSSTEVDDLFAKVSICYDGTLDGRFSLNRATYSLLHIENDYMHSHIPGIPKTDFSRFLEPCTGSGPINTTIHSLNSEFSEDLWRLFCLELSKFVEVESLNGGPYRRLDNLVPGGHSMASSPSRVGYRLESINRFLPPSSLSWLTVDRFVDFVNYVIDSGKLKFSFTGYYTIAMGIDEYILTLSNLFIEWFNKQQKDASGTTNSAIILNLESNSILQTAYMFDGHLVQKFSGERFNIGEHIGDYVCTFKGRRVTLQVTGYNSGNDSQEEDHSITILNLRLCEFILTKILYILNYRYGNSRNPEELANTGKTTVYL